MRCGYSPVTGVRLKSIASGYSLLVVATRNLGLYSLWVAMNRFFPDSHITYRIGIRKQSHSGVGPGVQGSAARPRFEGKEKLR